VIDPIIRKLEFFKEGGSEKHLRDIASILREADAELDPAYVEEEVRTRGLSAAWQRADAMVRL
jgi:hypothetical protein